MTSKSLTTRRNEVTTRLMRLLEEHRALITELAQLIEAENQVLIEYPVDWTPEWEPGVKK